MLRAVVLTVYYPGGASHSTLYPEASPSCPGDRQGGRMRSAQQTVLIQQKYLNKHFLFCYFLQIWSLNTKFIKCLMFSKFSRGWVDSGEAVHGNAVL